MNKFNNTKSSDVYHYTSSDALRFILQSAESSSLRATGIRYLNDQSELLHGVQIVLSVLKNRRSELHLNKNLADDLLDTFERTTLDEMSFKFFVTCFSRTTDMVDQWRGYGENGLGFSLGYNVHDIKKWFALKTNVTIAACLYGTEVQERVLIREVNASLDRLDLLQEPDETSNERYEKQKIWTVYALRTHLLRFKHSAYEQENEWRIILNPQAEPVLWRTDSLELPTEFRTSRRGLIPFVTLNMPAPRSLIVGPSEYQIENKAAAEMLLNSKGIIPGKDIEFLIENIPYRG